MNDVLSELNEHVWVMTLNRTDKHNAFDDKLLNQLQTSLDEANANPKVRVIVLKANGRHFSAGADLNWMKRMAQYSEQENRQDAMMLATLMHTLYESPKPTLAAVKGAAFGGGAGLVAACDIAIGATNAQFCFSEVKLGLIPAVISPYVIDAIGKKAAKWLFMSAETINAQRAYELQLLQHCVPEEELINFTLTLAQQMTQLAPLAQRDCKTLVREISSKSIDKALLEKTAELIAKKRISNEGQYGLTAFLNKETPNWN